jgi:FSR family fosmidomycin resistance protein-like MFS transporter
MNTTTIPKELFQTKTLANLSVYGASHFLVDAICAGALFTMLSAGITQSEIVFLFVLYNILAFGLQLPLGALCDKIQNPKVFAILGIIITLLGMFCLTLSPEIGIILLGIGNALFHIGGGSISLNLTPTKSSAPGIFVAPGALGLLVGTLLGKNNLFNPLIFTLIAIILILGLIEVPTPKMNYKKSNSKINYLELIILLLLLTIVARSIIGFAIVFPWKTDLILLLTLTIGIVLGKAFGGILGDKFGWIKVGVGGLIISAPLIYLGPQNYVLGIIGLFLFNFTMPITLTALSNTLPGKPGTAFGLTCLALLIGALPFFSELKKSLTNQILVLVIIIFSAIALYLALQKINQPNKKTRIIKKKRVK